MKIFFAGGLYWDKRESMLMRRGVRKRLVTFDRAGDSVSAARQWRTAEAAKKVKGKS